MTYKVAYIIGSLSSNSINRKLVGAMIADAPADLEFVEADFSKLPLYSPDYDANYPQIATDFKKILEDANAVLIATPEYDRSIPGGLKNAIDWFGRPWGSNPIGEACLCRGCIQGSGWCCYWADRDPSDS